MSWPQPRRRPRRVAPLAALVVGVGALMATTVGCSGGSGTGADNPPAQLAQGKQALDATSAVHFQLSSRNVPSGGTRLTGGDGDLVRPDRFQGSLSVTSGGFAADIKVLAAGGKFYAQLPFSSGYSQADPAQFGFGNPSALLDPQRGLTSLLTAATGVRRQNRDRLGGEVLEEVSASLPGDRVAALLTSADPTKPVTGLVGLAGGKQIRRVVLTGPFFVAGMPSTFTLLLTRYGESVMVNAPPG